MATVIEDDTERGRYEAFVDGKRAGYTSYRRRPDLIALDHTDVDERFAGRGFGSGLVLRALEDAREQGLAVLPFCPFANEYIQDHPAFADLVPAAERERFGL